MKQKTQKTLIAIACLCLGFGWLAYGIASATGGSARLYLSPSSGSYNIGDTINIGVYEDSGSTRVNAVQADLTYPTSQLTFVSITNSSAFGISAESSGGGGSVRITRGALPAVTGAQLVATVQFTASGSGTAIINFASDSNVEGPDDCTPSTGPNGPYCNPYNILSSTNGGSYTVSGSSTPPTNNPPTSSSTSSKPKSTGSSSTNKTTTASPATPAPAAPQLTISNLQVTNLGAKSATIEWQTSLEASSEVDFGTSTNYTLSAVDKTLTTTHSLALNPELLVAGTTYHYIVKSVDAAGTTTTSQDLTFSTTAPAAAVTAKKIAYGTIIVIGVASLAALSAVVGGIILEKKHAAAKDLARHFLRPSLTSQPAGSTNTYPGNSQIGNVIHPGNKL